MIEPKMQANLAREDLCRYLAACFYEPDPAFEEEGMFDALLAATRLVGPDLAAHAQRLGEAFKRATIDELLLDYTRLFLGPSSIPAKPYGSVWLEAEQTLMGNSTMAVLDLYRKADFEMDDDFKELPDHVAAELEFLYLLLFRENEARNSNDRDKLAAMLDLQDRFLSRHLGAWIERFSAAVRANAKCDFYRELADLTERFIVQQASRIRQT